MKILFLTQTAELGPASRYRVYQYLPYLKQQGIKYSISPAVSNRNFTALFNRRLKPMLKIPFYLLVAFKRMHNLINACRYDLIFIQREILPQCYPIFEVLLSKLHKKIIFDFVIFSP